MTLYTTLASTIVAAYTLVVIGVPTHCTLIGTTGPDEGFPVAHCADDSFVYADLDGLDGSLGPATSIRWRDASGYTLRGH